jgi:hypothetical protein
MALLATCAAPSGLHVGSQVFRRVRIYDEDGVLTDSTVVAEMSLGDATPVAQLVTHESTGVYLVTFTPFAARGIYHWRIAAEGPVYAVETGTLRVQP